MENGELRQVVNEVVEAKLEPIRAELKELNKQLTNEIVHLTANFYTISTSFAELKNDVCWLKKYFDPKGNEVVNAKQEGNIEWMTWAIRIIIAGMITNILAVGYHIFFS